MIDFAVLPPEVNSARMYAGAGASPLLEAGAAWSTVAESLAETASAVGSQVMGLAGVWIGPSASAMTASATTYTSWLTSSAAAAAQTATQAQAAAAAYETAYAATVPPPAIVANRAQLATLVATNFLGINTAAIAATEAAYAEMWAQDVAAMTGYQAQSAAAVEALPTFTAAPQVAVPTPPPFLQWLLGGQTIPQLFWALTESFVSSGPYNLPIEMLSLFTVLWGVSSASSPLSQAINNRITPQFMVPEYTPPAPSVLPRGGGRSPGWGRLGVGERVGGLTTPPSWVAPQTTPPAGTPLEQRRDSNGKTIPMPLPLPLPIPAGASSGQSKPAPQYGTKPTVMPRHPWGG